MSDASTHPDTAVVHAGQSCCGLTGAVMPPVYLTSTYAQASPGVHQGFEYTRSHNPTRYAFERCIARLEGSTLTEEQDASYGGFAFSSGLASIGTLLDTLTAGDHVVAMDDLYGGTHRLFNKVRARSAGLRFTTVDMTDIDQLAAAITPETKLVWVESPTNPMLKVVDLEAVAAMCRERGILAACDNTFASPMLQQPLGLGFDIVMHSATKYLGGHSDMVGGVLVTNDADLAETLRFHQNSVGSVLSPFDSYLGLRGIKTLGLRMRRHCSSAARLAAWLEQHATVDSVIYPGLASHPQHETASRLMTLDGQPAGGGMITLTLNSDLAGCRRFLENLTVFALAESLGGVESLVNHPAIMTHASVDPEVRAQLGIEDTLVRLSVGIEDAEDLQADLDRALAAMTA
ncbi:MAG: PLP-dependent aspartate aminotransferase family protein [Phycisphaerales bacterium]|nr:PLP-dependent aspartate aminotransferase family protein [Phycisphaerales bacterium]